MFLSSATLWRDKLSLLLGLTKGNKSASLAGAYSETPYRALIHRESKRSERSGHFCRILLVYRTNAQGLVVPLQAQLAEEMLSVLSSGCRDTDYVGWYRQGRILGVLLTALQPDSADDGSDKLKTRLADGLRGALTFKDEHSLQIRVLDQSDLTTFNVADHPASFPGSKG